MSVLLLHLPGLVPTSPAKLGNLHCCVPASESLALTWAFVSIWMTEIMCANHLLFSRLREQHWCSYVGSAKDSRVVRKFWNLHRWRPSHPNKLMSDALIGPALSWVPSSPALVEKAVYGSSWISATSLSWTECTHTRKAAGFCWQTRKDYFLILTQHTPVSQAQNYLKTSFSSAAFPTSRGRCVKHLWRGDWSPGKVWFLG